MTEVHTRLVADIVIPAEGTGRVISNGAIDIDADGRILAVDPIGQLGDFDGDTQRIGGLVMPGLVNTHAHTPMTLVRSIGDGLPLDRWLQEAVWPREGKMTPDDAQWGMVLGSIEMLRAGVTTSVESYFFEDQIVAAANETGQRVCVGAGILSAILPTDTDFENRVSEVAAFVAKNHDPNGQIRAVFSPHSVYDVSPERLSVIAEAAREKQSMIHIHLEETQAERDLVLKNHGRSATQILADSGILEVPTLAAHGVWLDDADRSLLATAGAGVAHCPQSNGKLGSGIADVSALIDAGIAVGIGTDGPASNDNLDLWEELRLAPLLARASSTNPEAMDAALAIDLATRQGARAAGMTDVGELRPGAWADLIRLDIDYPEFVVGSSDEILSNLVWSGSAHHVTDVWVGGQRVVRNRECVTSDRHVAQEQVRNRARSLC